MPHWSPKSPGYALPANQVTGISAAKLPPGIPRGAATECADVPDTTCGDGKIADEAIRGLQAAKENPSQPFFIAVGFLKPHLPIVAPRGAKKLLLG